MSAAAGSSELRHLWGGKEATDRKNRTENGEHKHGEHPQEQWGSTRESNADRQQQLEEREC